MIEEDDEDTIQDNSELRVRFEYCRFHEVTDALITQGLMPFAIVGSEEEIEIDGQPVRARIYPW